MAEDVLEQEYVFISYSRRDKEEVLSTIEELREGGITVWVDMEGIPGGSQWAREIVRAIRRCRVFMLMLTENSCDSININRELALASEWGKDVLPVLLSPVEIEDEMAYRLAGIQRVSVFDKPREKGLADVLRALKGAGLLPSSMPGQTLSPKTRDVKSESVKENITSTTSSTEEFKSRITLDVIEGPICGKQYVFDQHDTFIFGRGEDCHARIDDEFVSRHHFVLETNPPDALLRDLGSLNGTFVNSEKHGGRADGETPDEAAKRQSTDVRIVDRDWISVGQTVLVAHVDVSGEDAKSEAPVCCQVCGKDVSQEAASSRRGKYTCANCQNKSFESNMDIEGYDVERQLGKSEFGGVCLARRLSDDSPVAIKIMYSKVAVDEGSRRTFLKEIQEIKSLEHKNIVSLFECRSEGSSFHIMMEYCAGGSVVSLMGQKNGKLSIDDAIKIMLQVLEGMAFIHNRNIVHRNLKPSNILLSSDNNGIVAKISDLGLTRSFQQTGLSGMTMNGALLEMPHFTPREQLMDFKSIQAASDVWSLGASFYNMVTGSFPRDVPPGGDVMDVIIDGKTVPVNERDPSIPGYVAALINTALSDNPRDRYQTAIEMYEEFVRTI